jgi:predicted DNA-binding ribbon-helix-helix protein
LILWKYCSFALENKSECTRPTIGARPNRQVGYIFLLEDTHMESPIVKRSVVINGHKTSVSLENAFWSGLKEIAHGRHMTLSNMVCDIDRRRQQSNLSSAIRLFVLDSARNQFSGYAGVRVGEDIIRENGKAHV